MQLRRLLVAFIIVTSGFIVGAAAAGAQSGAAGETFAVPAIHVGDQGQYNASDGRWVRFVFAEPETWFLDDGTPVAAVPLRMENETGWQWTHWLEADSLVPIATRAWEGGGGSGFGFGNDLITYWRYSGYLAHQTVWDDPGPWCGLVHGLQGKTADDEAVLALTGDCPAAAAEPGGRVDHDGLVGRSYTAPGVSLTLVGEASVPLQITRDGATWDLVLYGRGAGPGEAEAGDPLPVQDAPYRHGPDLAGAEHPFPLDDAVEAALFDPVGNPIKTFFADHPGAYIASASHREHYEPGSRTRSWHVVATDGKDAAAARIIQDGADVARTTSGYSVGTGLILPGSPVPRVEAAAAPPGPFPSPDALPDRMPTVASVATRWEEHARPGEAFGGLDGYGFAFTCRQADDCRTAEVEVWAGTDRTQRQSSSAVPEPCILVCARAVDVWMASYLAVDGAGFSTWMIETDWAYVEGAGYDFNEPLVLGPSASVEGRDDKESTSQAGLWAWPSGPATAGVSFISVILGALYYFWPALKAAPIALFSRVRKHEALDHPVRKVIHDAVIAEPGIHMNALARRVGKKGGVLRHHLDILVGKGLLKARRERGYTCYFPATAGRLEMDHAAVLRNGTARDLLATVQGRPGATMQEVAAQLGVTPGTVTYHARRLEQKGLLHARRAGRERRLYAA